MKQVEGEAYKLLPEHQVAEVLRNVGIENLPLKPGVSAQEPADQSEEKEGGQKNQTQVKDVKIEVPPEPEVNMPEQVETGANTEHEPATGVEETTIPQIFQEEQKTKRSVFMIDLKKIDELSLAGELKRIFNHKEKKTQIPPEIKKKIVFTLNNLDEEKLDLKAKEISSNIKGDKLRQWLALAIVFDRVPTTDQSFMQLYSELLHKFKDEQMSKRVIVYSYKLINICFDYAYHKSELTPEERKMVRSCGKWFGLITIGSNKPILRKELDVKEKIYEALETQKVDKLLPIVINIFESVKISKLFKKNNPYIMAILSIMTEVMDDRNVKNVTTATILTLFKDLGVERQSDISPFGYIKSKRNSKNNKNKFFTNSLPNYICIDQRTLGPYLLQIGVDLRQLVATAVDQAVKEITKPVLQRSVNIALFTTRELVLKDFAFEPDEEKLIHAARIMVTNLAGNLALVTCREPLRMHIRDNLEMALNTQTELDEKSKETIKDIASLDNLELACAIVKKKIIDKALDEVNRDQTIFQAIEVRKQARERKENYYDPNALQSQQRLPTNLRGDSQIKNIDIYEKFASDSNGQDLFPDISGSKLHQKFYNKGQHSDSIYHYQEQQIELDVNQINDILKQLEKEIPNPQSDKKAKAIHIIYGNLSKVLQRYKNVERYIFKLAETVLESLFSTPPNPEKLCYYTDILVIYSNYDQNLSKDITNWIFQLPTEKRYLQEIFVVFLRRNLVHLLKFDQMYAAALSEVTLNFLDPLICIVQVLKILVIEERIFMINTFSLVVEKILSFHNTKFYNHLTPEVTIFIDNLIKFKSTNDYISSIKFRLTNLEPEYKKLLTDVEDYFSNPDIEFYNLSMKFLRDWLDSSKETEMGEFIRNFESQITLKGDKTTISFFCYIFDVSCKKATMNVGLNESVGKHLKLDYTYIDLVSKMITILLKTLINFEDTSKINLLERILTAVIIVITKEHHYNSHRFNQKPFFKLIFNILYDLNRKEYKFGNNVHSMLLTIVQTLNVLQPIKYPGFAYSWLQLVSSKFLMAPLLKERTLWAQFKILILDLIIFYKEVFTIKSLSTPEMKMFYKGTLRLLLVLLHDYPDFLCDFSFCLLEEIPDYFMQVKNIIISAYPKGMRIPDPFDSEIFGRTEMSEEYKKMPLINSKVEERINSHNLHNLIINCIKNSGQNDFETIKKSFYVSGYKDDTQINKSLLDSFVLYVPVFIFSNLDTAKHHQAFNTYKQDSQMLFVKLIKESDYELRDVLINSILNNIRYPNQITFYFTSLILIIFSDVDNDAIHEQITRNLFERLIIEKPHPWGILSLLYKLLTDNKYTIESKDFYQEKLSLMEQLIKYVFKYVRISDVETNEELETTNDTQDEETKAVNPN